MVAQRHQPLAIFIGDEGIDQIDAVVRQFGFQLIAEPGPQLAFRAQSQAAQLVRIALRPVGYAARRHQQGGVILNAALDLELCVVAGKLRAALPADLGGRFARSPRFGRAGKRRWNSRSGRTPRTRRSRNRRCHIKARFQHLHLRLERGDLRAQLLGFGLADRLCARP